LSSPATSIIYDDAHIRVIWHPGHSEYVLITFADLLITVDGHRFFADKPVAKLGLNCIGILATGGNFYPKASVRAALPAIMAHISGFSQRVVYGGSMGGYAAVKHSALLGATEVIALCPPWSIDPAECEGNFPGWPQLMHPALEGMGTRPEEISGAVFVFADMFDQVDKFQANMILRMDPTATIIQVPMVQHNVVPVFAGTEVLRRLIDACRNRRTAELIKMSRELRKNSPWRLAGLVATAINRHPGLTYQVMASRRPQDMTSGMLGAEHLFRAVGYLAGRGDRAAALAFVETFRHGLLDPNDMVHAAAARGQLAQRDMTITTRHQTILVYHTARRVCLHVARVNQLIHVPVRLQVAQGLARLFVFVGGIRVELGVGPDAQLTGQFGEGTTANGAVFVIGARYNGAFSLCAAGSFLSAEPDGPVRCDRPVAYDWEHFQLN
jgi:hypothetical protein